MSFPSYNDAYQAGLMDGLYDRPRASTALAYRKGYDAGFSFYLRCTYTDEEE